MALVDGFNMDADITVSELRQEELLGERLHTHHRLRLRRRNDVLGVIVEADAWRALSAYVKDLEAQVQRLEDHVAGNLIAQRAPGAQFVQSTPDVIDDIDRRYRAIVGE